MKIKVLSALLVMLMLFCSFASCKSNDEGDQGELPTDSGTKATETTESIDSDSVPAIDMENKEIRVLHRTLGDCSFYDELMPSEVEGDIVSAAMMRRNASVEEKYNIKLLSVAMSPTDSSFSQIQTWTNANQHFCDIINWRAREVASLATQGYLVEYSQLPYVDTTTGYWYQEILKDVSIAGRTYFASNDMNLGTMVSTAVIYFNVKAYADRGLSDTYGSLYDIVKEKRWTTELMKEMIANSYIDSDGSEGISDGDTYGLVVDPGSWYAFFYGSGYRLCNKDEADKPVLKMTTETVQKLLEDTVWICRNEDTTLYTTSAHIKSFSAARSCFLSEFLYCAFQLNSVMESEYGIIPPPMSIAGQDKYYSCVHPIHATVTAVPMTLPYDDYLNISAIVQDMAYYSQKEVRPTFYDDLLKLRIARTVDNYLIFDMLFENVVLDPAMIYVSEIDGKIRNFVKAKSTPSFDNAESAYQLALDRIVASVLEKDY